MMKAMNRRGLAGLMGAIAGAFVTRKVEAQTIPPNALYCPPQLGPLLEAGGDGESPDLRECVPGQTRLLFGESGQILNEVAQGLDCNWYWLDRGHTCRRAHD